MSIQQVLHFGFARQSLHLRSENVDNKVPRTTINKVFLHSILNKVLIGGVPRRYNRANWDRSPGFESGGRSLFLTSWHIIDLSFWTCSYVCWCTTYIQNFETSQHRSRSSAIRMECGYNTTHYGQSLLQLLAEVTPWLGLNTGLLK